MRIFITGLTGTLGTAIAQYHHSQGDQVWGCSRSESRAVQWLSKYSHLGTLYLTCASTLYAGTSDASRILPTMDRLYHCAAMKHVILCEETPYGASLQNIVHTECVAVACAENSVPMVFASTDKACMSQGVYGATKLIAERIVIKHGGAVVRLVNLIGSSGSVFQIWQQQVREGKPITITDPEMTRYFMTTSKVAQFMAEHSMPGKVIIPYCHSVRMGLVANHLANPHGIKIQVTGARPGEVKHQWLIAPGEMAEASPHSYTLYQGVVRDRGLSSEHGPFWDMTELLSEVNKS